MYQTGSAAPDFYGAKGKEVTFNANFFIGFGCPNQENFFGLIIYPPRLMG